MSTPHLGLNGMSEELVTITHTSSRVLGCDAIITQ
jgi:hypothetical protein